MRKYTTTSILAAAVTGLVIGGMTSCQSTGDMPKAWDMGLEKHACANMNSCQGKGGCKTAENDCAAKNSCEGKGGCATVAHHDCGGKNDCRALGGCKTATNECAGHNDCKAKGGCHVPVKSKH